MKVKELIRKLMDCDPEATVCVEAFCDSKAETVKQYHTDYGDCLYIADSTEYLDEEDTLEEYKCSGVQSLDLFLEDEIPFRLSEIMCVDEENANKVKDEILDKLCVGRGGTFDFFDYDALDSFITDVLDKHGIEHGG